MPRNNYDQILCWKQVFNTIYDRAFDEKNKIFNLTGWNSRYDGRPIPYDEMLAWVDETIDRIQYTKPKRIYEIGSGTGLLLFKLIDKCKHYCASDFSEQAVSYLKENLPTTANHVEILLATADNTSKMTKERYDTVILNSVIQYFPDYFYLKKVLANTIENIASGGTIFIGDVRNSLLLEALYTSIEVFKSNIDITSKELTKCIKNSILSDNELCLPPSFFCELKKKFPRISQVEIRYKKGLYQNELTQFRYDVFLHIEKPKGNILKNFQWNDDLTLIQKLVKTKTPIFQIDEIPNPSIQSILKVVDLLKKDEKSLSLKELVDKRNQGTQSLTWDNIYDLAGDTYSFEPFWDPNHFDKLSLVFFNQNIPQSEIFPIITAPM